MDREILHDLDGAQTSKNDPVRLADYRESRRLRAVKPALPPLRAYPPANNAPPAPDRKQLYRERLADATNTAVSATMTPSTQTKALSIIRGLRKAGRPYHGAIEITDEMREQVAMMATARITHKDIAAVLGISVPTLRKFFPDELEVVPLVQTALVGDKALQMALSGTDFNATKFWLKVNGWRETPEADVKNSNNNQVNVMVHIGGVDANL